MAKVLQDLKDNPRDESEAASIEDEFKQLQESDPALAEKIKNLGSTPMKPYRSIALVTLRIHQLMDVVQDLEKAKPRMHKLILMYDQALQKYIELNGRLMSEFGKIEEATQDLSQAVSFITKQMKDGGGKVEEKS
jgi:hypothetical protein